jgi:TonB family protein
VDNATAAVATLPGSKRPGLSPKALLAGAAALFLLAVAAIAVVLLRRAPEPASTVASNPTPQATIAAATPAPPVEITGTLHVETEPPGAAVSVNGETHGATPMDLGNVPLGSYEVKLELKGYEPKTQTVDLREDALHGEVKVALTKAAATGFADFTSTPPGATVTVDGARIGKTPLTGIKLRSGPRTIVVSEDGYDAWSGTLLIETGQRSRIDARLRALVRETPPPAALEVVDTTRVYPNTPTEVDTPARKISGTTVSYPEAAPRLRSGDSVSVGVVFVVNEGGEVTELRVVESGGKVLDEAVTAGVRSWKYAPAVKKGTKVKVQIAFKQTFRAG